MFLSIPILYSQLSSQIENLKPDASSIKKLRQIVEKALSRDEPFYGISTGFGALANKRVNGEQLRQLQRNFILSHSVGEGDLVPKDISWLIFQLKIHSLGLGYSGISEETFDRLISFLQPLNTDLLTTFRMTPGFCKAAYSSHQC